METDVIISSDTYQYENINWEDQLTKFNNQEITYDEIGNPLSIGNNITLDWINGRSLSSYQDTSKNLNINYKYNRDGIRAEKEINGVTTKYHLENSSIIYEERGNSTIYYLYDLTGLVGLKYNDNTYYYIKNIQGDIIGILDQDYNEIVTYEYDSWGKLLSIKDNQGNEITEETNIGIINPFRYREYYYDTETGLYYLNSRYYNPTWGRFLNADLLLGANKDIICYNLYAYVSNNPINNTDSNGKFFGKAWKNIKEGCKKFGKAAVDVWNAGCKIFTDVYNGVCSTVNKLKNAFVFEAEVGFGVGVGGQIGPAKVELKATKTIGYGYSNNQTYEYTSDSVGGSVGIENKEFGLSFELRNYDEGLINPMGMPWEVWNDPYVTKEWSYGFTKKTTKNSGVTRETSKSGRFIGFCIEAYPFVGGKIKIGFNI